MENKQLIINTAGFALKKKIYALEKGQLVEQKEIAEDEIKNTILDFVLNKGYSVVQIVGQKDYNAKFKKETEEELITKNSLVKIDLV